MSDGNNMTRFSFNLVFWLWNVHAECCVWQCACVCVRNNLNAFYDYFYVKVPVLAQLSRLANRRLSRWTPKLPEKARWRAASARQRGWSLTWTWLKMRMAHSTSSTRRHSLASMWSASALEGSTSLTVRSKSRWVICTCKPALLESHENFSVSDTVIKNDPQLGEAEFSLKRHPQWKQAAAWSWWREKTKSPTWDDYGRDNWQEVGPR